MLQRVRVLERVFEPDLEHSANRRPTLTHRGKAYLLTRKDAAMRKPTELCATVSSKGQVVIPGDVRRHLRLVQGSVLRFVVDADGVRLLPAAGDVRRLKGRLPKPPQPVSVDDMNAAIADRRVRIATG